MYTREELEKFHGKQVRVQSSYTEYVYVGTFDAYYSSEVRIYNLVETSSPRYTPGEYLFISVDNIRSIESINDPATLYRRYLPSVQHKGS